MPASRKSRKEMKLAGGRKAYEAQLKRPQKDQLKYLGPQAHHAPLRPDVEDRLEERLLKKLYGDRPDDDDDGGKARQRRRLSGRERRSYDPVEGAEKRRQYIMRMFVAEKRLRCFVCRAPDTVFWAKTGISDHHGPWALCRPCKIDGDRRKEAKEQQQKR